MERGGRAIRSAREVPATQAPPRSLRTRRAHLDLDAGHEGGRVCAGRVDPLEVGDLGGPALPEADDETDWLRLGHVESANGREAFVEHLRLVVLLGRLRLGPDDVAAVGPGGDVDRFRARHEAGLGDDLPLA